jgi:putative polyhydroxyalkanoate system protein
VADIVIERAHQLGLAGAREVAHRWMRKAEEAYGLECRYVEGADGDQAAFTREGVDGRVEVGADRLRLEATLGFLFAAFSGQIEQRLASSLDELLAGAAPA